MFQHLKRIPTYIPLFNQFFLYIYLVLQPYDVLVHPYQPLLHWSILASFYFESLAIYFNGNCYYFSISLIHNWLLV